MRALRTAIKTLIFSVALSCLLTKQVPVLLVAMENIQHDLLRLSAYKARRSSKAWLVSMMCYGRKYYKLNNFTYNFTLLQVANSPKLGPVAQDPLLRTNIVAKIEH